MTALATRHQRDVVTHLVAREFRLRYRRSALGWLWSIVTPLARLVVLTFIFTQVIPLDIEDYGVFLYTGLIAWSWFAAGVMSGSASVVERADLLLRPGLSRIIVPAVSVMGDTVDYLVALPVLLVFGVVSGIAPSVALVYLPILALAQLLLILGIGLALSPLHVLFRDVGKVLEVAMLLGFYATPVFYDPETIPEGYRWITQLNPMAHQLRAQRSVILDGQWPGTATVVGLLALGVVVLAVGATIYRRASPTFLDEL